jgi:hypothetical protein
VTPNKNHMVNRIIDFFFDMTAPSEPWPPHSRGFYITHNDAPQSVGLFQTSDQLVAETSSWQHKILTTDIHAPVGFKPTISAGERPQTYVLDPEATGTGVAFLPYFTTLCGWQNGGCIRSVNVAVSKWKVAEFDGLLKDMNIWVILI